MEVGDIVLAPYKEQYFPGKIVSISTKKSGWLWFKKEKTMARVVMHLKEKLFSEKEWSDLTISVEVPVSELIKYD